MWYSVGFIFYLDAGASRSSKKLFCLVSPAARDTLARQLFYLNSPLPPYVFTLSFAWFSWQYRARFPTPFSNGISSERYTGRVHLRSTVQHTTGSVLSVSCIRRRFIILLVLAILLKSIRVYNSSLRLHAGRLSLSREISRRSLVLIEFGSSTTP